MKVSILIAARNEADNILDCLKSVEALSYPKDQLQVLVGDDASDDETATLVDDFIKDKPHFELFHIKQLPESVEAHQQLSGNLQLKGKTNVLAQLSQYATGDYLFFTDADIEVPADWIQNMLCHFKPNVGIVTGITTMKTDRFPLWGRSLKSLEGFQALEWLYYLAIMRLFSLFNIPITAMGNNMAVTRTAYDAVGGYENIPFSITEDYALFRSILEKGFRFVQLFDRRVLTISKPIPTFSQLLIQRKRWMYGAISLPWAQRLGVYLNAFLLPFLLVLSFFFPKIALFFVFLSYFSATAWLVGILNWIQRPQLFVVVPFFWFYHLFMNFAMFINFYVRKNTVWKGREY